MYDHIVYRRIQYSQSTPKEEHENTQGNGSVYLQTHADSVKHVQYYSWNM